jgi:hypothetical protein
MAKEKGKNSRKGAILCQNLEGSFLCDLNVLSDFGILSETLFRS